jgi:hypothetical protein
MTGQSRGWVISAGGIGWLVGVLVLGTTYTDTDEGLPVIFLVLAVFAGFAAGWGIWSMARSLDNRLARIGGRLVGLSSGLFGVGFGLDLLPFDTGIGFLLAYSFGLFVLPLGFLLLGVGVLPSTVFPGWAKWVPLTVVAVAAITYGFHALARNMWDPPDAVWFFTIGVGWILLGLASRRIPLGAPSLEM